MKIKTLIFILLVSYSLMEDKKTFGWLKSYQNHVMKGNMKLFYQGKSDTITSEIK